MPWTLATTTWDLQGWEAAARADGDNFAKCHMIDLSIWREKLRDRTAGHRKPGLLTVMMAVYF